MDSMSVFLSTVKIGIPNIMAILSSPVLPTTRDAFLFFDHYTIRHELSVSIPVGFSDKLRQIGRYRTAYRLI